MLKSNIISSKTKILFICHGNICRSTMAQSVMQYLVDNASLSEKFYIDSAATSREEIGNGVHYGTREKLRKEKIPCIPHRARQITIDDYNDFDFLIGMDSENISNMRRILGEDTDGKFHKLLEYAQINQSARMNDSFARITNADYKFTNGKTFRSMENIPDIADPWYTGNFDETFTDVMAGCSGLFSFLCGKID